MSVDRVQWLQELEINFDPEQPLEQILEPFIRNAFEQLMALYNLVVNYNIIKVKISKFTHDYTDISFDIIGDENSLNQIYIALNTHPTDDSIYMCMYDKRFLVEVINKNETILSIRLTNISV